MKNDSLNELIESLKIEFSEDLVVHSSSGKRRFSPQFKKRLLLEVERGNISETLLADALDMSRSLFYRWRRESSSRTGKKSRSTMQAFKKIEIEDEKNAFPVIYLEGKAGVRIVGLSLGQIAEVLRSL
jgi:transposase-like protein